MQHKDRYGLSILLIALLMFSLVSAGNQKVCHTKMKVTFVQMS